MVNIMVGSADCVIKGQGIVMQIHFRHVISCIRFFYYYQVSWVSQIYCGFMFFSMTPLHKGKFLTMIAVCHHQGREN